MWIAEVVEMEFIREEGSTADMECVYFEAYERKTREIQYSLPNECLEKFKESH